MNKECSKCRVTKPISEFYAHTSKCKDCTRRAVRLNYAKKREQYAEYERRRERTPEREASKHRATVRHRLTQPSHRRARQAVNNAIRDGRLLPQSCEVCGSRAQAHHSDYSRPLDVRWLCFKHHRELEHAQVVSS